MMDFIVTSSTGHMLNGKSFHLANPVIGNKYHISHLSDHYLELVHFDGTNVRLLNSNISFVGKKI